MRGRKDVNFYLQSMTRNSNPAIVRRSLGARKIHEQTLYIRYKRNTNLQKAEVKNNHITKRQKKRSFSFKINEMQKIQSRRERYFKIH